METRDIEALREEMRPLVLTVVDRCWREAGFRLLIYSTERDLGIQNKLYRRGRSRRSINLKCLRLISRGYPELGRALYYTTPQRQTRKVTNAAGGESWHNWQEAADGVPLVGGKPLWSTSHPEWMEYGRIAEEVGLFWAGRWKRFREFPHIQYRWHPNPLGVWSRDVVVDKFLLPRMSEKEVVGLQLKIRNEVYPNRMRR